MLFSRKKFAILVTIMFGVALLAWPALAVDLGLDYGSTLGLTTTDIRTTIGRIINAFLGLLGIVVVLLILYAGWLWMTAGGDALKVDRAKKILRNAIIGLVIIMSSYAIASFILGAIMRGTVSEFEGGSGGAGGGGGIPGSSTSFSVKGVVPVGAGPGDGGWPRTWAIQVNFNSDISESTVSSSSFQVTRCNPRLVGGDPQPFDQADCDTTVSGTRTVVNQQTILFRPDSTPVEDADDDPTYFESDYWYAVSVNDSLQDTDGRSLQCWISLDDISSPSSPGHLCDRAMAFNDIIDVESPTVSIQMPSRFPPQCSQHIEIRAMATDDFMPSRVDFLLNGTEDNFVDFSVSPLPNGVVTNDPPLVEPLSDFLVAETIYIDARNLDYGVPQTLTAIAYDGVPQASREASVTFTIAPPECCGENPECGPDSACGLCAGQQCVDHADCASGFCNPDTGVCEYRPTINSVTPSAGSVGNLITLSGTYFGNQEGTVTFLGGAGDADDVVVEACAAAAWNWNEVIVPVPLDAADGPLMLETSVGSSDTTSDEYGVVLNFDVNGVVYPGICYINPRSGPSGTELEIHGINFGDEIGDSLARMDGIELSRAGMTWTDSLITAFVPTVLREAVYPVTVTLNGDGGPTSNPAKYTLNLSSSGVGPRIEEILPSAGPVGSYITLLGSGFGNSRGQVLFHFTGSDDIAFGAEPICADNWRDNYIVIKVPEATPEPGSRRVDPDDYQIQVVTRISGQTSNMFDFEVNEANVPPGMCSISPAAGPPGTPVQVIGEFDAVPLAARGARPGETENSLRFYVNGAVSDSANPRPDIDLETIPAVDYPNWQRNTMDAVVPLGPGGAWPNSGPTYLVQDNAWAKNPIPFRVANCNEEENVCAEDEVCCPSGACNALGAPCKVERRSAYGWLFSTGPIPAFPMVHHTNCYFDQGIEQSPSPANRSTDACIETSIGVTFTELMDAESLRGEGNITVTECGDGSTPNCINGNTVPINTGDPAEFAVGVIDLAPSRPVSKLDIRPDADFYPVGEETGLLLPAHWYRVTLKSDPATRQGIIDERGRLLDGDRNHQEGGEYTWFFQTREADDPCEIAGVLVDPGHYTFKVQHVADRFNAKPTAANCNELPCVGRDAYNIDWNIEGQHILADPRPGNPVPPAPEHCFYMAMAESETGTEPDEIFANLTPVGRSLTMTGRSEVRVAFVDPAVKRVSPVDGCQEACTNGAIFAEFNIPMSPASLSESNIELRPCRNAACNPPYELPLDIDVSWEDGDGLPRALFDEDVTRVSIAPAGGNDLAISTSYVVRLRGATPNSIRSLSGVPLTGLNAGGWYEWRFRTIEDSQGCEIGRLDLQPDYATLYYVGQRLGLKLLAYSRPNSCDSEGQELRTNSYDWDWDVNPNPVLQGFIDADDFRSVPADPDVGIDNTVDTDPVAALGCNSSCLLVGSSPNVSVCGNGGDPEVGEDCDDGNRESDDGCGLDCKVTGSNAPRCGNGLIEAGENCEALPDPQIPDSLIFPAGCKDPADDYDENGEPDGWGCVLQGSKAGIRSVCGNGIREDGEACEDGNSSNGDGCSSNCLNEGTKRGVSSCGNGVREVGEECDDSNANNGDGCNSSCLLEGSSLAYGSVCGNGSIQTGEACDDSNTDNGDGCSSECLLEGSSAFYDEPAFCGDGRLAPSEHPDCDGGDAVIPDNNTDSYQVVQSRNIDVNDPAGLTSTVIATHPEVPLGQEGNSYVSLSCTCGEEEDGDAFCESFNHATGCADSGCCIPKPDVSSFGPSSNRDDICRNGIITVYFDQLMNHASIKQNLMVGYDSGSVDGCPDPNRTVPAPGGFALSNFERPSLLARIWNGVVDLVQQYVLTPVFGSPPDARDENNQFCQVEGKIVTRDSDDGSVTVAEFWPSEPYPADTWLRVRVLPEAKSAAGVAIGDSPRAATTDFGTGSEICRIRLATITPATDLLSTVEDEHLYVAHAYSNTDMPIAPMDVYEWEWSWTEQADGGAEGTDPISPVVIDSTLPTGETWTHDISFDNHARIRVRGSRTWDAPGLDIYSPQDGEAVVQAIATVTSSDLGDLDESYAGRGDVVVMLCNNPWPMWRTCPAGGNIQLPWEQNDGVGDPEVVPEHDCGIPNARVWYPFTDRWTNTKFYYCRDGSTAGDEGDLLPYLNIGENSQPITRLINPAPGIMREYLFTMDPLLSEDGDWRRDAFGLRIAANPEHNGVFDWYADQGFQGTPEYLPVSGYDGLRDNRSVYVNAGVLSGNNLFTNVYVLSTNEGSAPETGSIFNQIIKKIDFNDNLNDVFVCAVDGVPVHPDGDAEATIACDIDADCEVGTCDASSAKLKRDVRRWSDMHVMRKTLDAYGTPPQLREGTFMRSRTYSVWPSWSELLANQIGADLPVDPINNIHDCPEVGFDPNTCWNSADRQFFCGTKSYLYRYYSQSGQARINADLEFTDGVSWAYGGGTCLDPVTQDTCEARGCAWIDLGAGVSKCNYPNTKVWLNGYQSDITLCAGTEISEEGECGNGVLNDGEQCELGMRRSASCTGIKEVDGSPVEGGSFEQACDNNCRWTPESVDPEACFVGYCGDGVVQSQTQGEICDDGILNGTYGHCATNCMSMGFRCGDGQQHPSEVCDCGTYNGRYYVNGILADFGGGDCADGSFDAASARSCSWDCQGPASHCGDGVVNGGEDCDGGVQVSRGVCEGTGGNAEHPKGSPCTDNADCGNSGPCHFCETVEQSYFRACNINNISSADDDLSTSANRSCTWGQWTCSEPGFCGNGVTEVGEQCDDGNSENNDPCTNKCKINVCGDNYVNWAGGELCDDEIDNGKPCQPGYDETCTFCTTSCQISVVSGDYCGDGIVQEPWDDPPGREGCEPESYLENVSHVCVSERDKDLSFGRFTGFASCSEASCNVSCLDRESTLCDLNKVQDYERENNYDDESCRVSRYSGVGSDAQDYCNEQKIASEELYSSYSLIDACDPDDDNDGVPDILDCNDTEPEEHPEYHIPGTSIVIEAGEEYRCDGLDNDCSGEADDAPHMHDKVDMVFAIDISGSMDDLIRNVRNAIDILTGSLRGTDHQFAVVPFSQDPVIPELVLHYESPNCGYNAIMPFGSRSQLMNKLNCMLGEDCPTSVEYEQSPNCDNTDVTEWEWTPLWNVHEPSYAIAYEIMSADSELNTTMRTNGLDWRDDAHPYVIIITDEPPPVGGTWRGGHKSYWYDCTGEDGPDGRNTDGPCNYLNCGADCSCGYDDTAMDREDGVDVYSWCYTPGDGNNIDYDFYRHKPAALDPDIHDETVPVPDYYVDTLLDEDNDLVTIWDYYCDILGYDAYDCEDEFDGTSEVGRIGLQGVADKALNCELPGCQEGDHVEFFVMSFESYKLLWKDALPHDANLMTADDRYVAIEDMDEGNEEDLATAAACTLADSIFAFVCGGGSAGTLSEVCDVQIPIGETSDQE